MATKQISVFIGEEPDALPTIEFLDGTATAEIVFSGVVGRYAVRVTGDGIVSFFVKWTAATTPKEKAYSISFLATGDLDVPAIVAGVNASATGVNAAEILKVPRAAVAMNGGDDFALNAVTDTTTKLTVNYTSEA
jgi:hypothetical protein